MAPGARSCKSAAWRSANVPMPGICSRPDAVAEVARAYVEAGSRVILTNTFRAQPRGPGRIRTGGRRVRHQSRRRRHLRARRPASRRACSHPWDPRARCWLPARSPRNASRGLRRTGRGAGRGRGGRAADRNHERRGGGSLALAAARKTGLPVIVSFSFDTGKHKDRTMTGVTPETGRPAHDGRRGRRGGRELRHRHRGIRAHLQPPARRDVAARLDQSRMPACPKWRTGSRCIAPPRSSLPRACRT